MAQSIVQISIGRASKGQQDITTYFGYHSQANKPAPETDEATQLSQDSALGCTDCDGGRKGMTDRDQTITNVKDR